MGMISIEIPPRRAPALIGLRSKSLYGSSEERRAMMRVAAAARGIDATLPVILGNRVIGWVRGHSLSPAVEMIGGLDQMISAATVSGQSLNQIFQKMQDVINLTVGIWYDFYPVGLGGGTYTGTALTAFQLTETSAGSIPHGGNVSPAIKAVTGGWLVSHLVGGVFILYDRVLTYEACTISGGLQNMVNTLPAQRYISAGQPGLMISPTFQTPAGGSSDISALVYVDQAGNTGQTVPTGSALSLDTTASATPGPLAASQCAVKFANLASASALFLPLNAGDSGVQSITSFTTSVARTGSLCFVLAHPIAYLPVPAPATGGEADWVRQIATLERIFDGASLHWFLNSSSNNSPVLTGALSFVWA